jgi:hypothetical protein
VVLQQIIDAWRLAPALNHFGPTLEPGAIDTAERQLGRPLPTDLITLYGLGDGFSVVGGNLFLDPLTGEMGLPGHSDQLREWGWENPPDVLMFGTNGGGELFGLWYPDGADPAGPTPVVEIGSVFEPDCMALVGTDLAPFLRAWTAYYFLICEAPAVALDAIDLPTHLRVAEPESLEPYFRWADPDLPNHDPDPYTDRLDAAAAALLVERIG